MRNQAGGLLREEPSRLEETARGKAVMVGCVGDCNRPMWLKLRRWGRVITLGAGPGGLFKFLWDKMGDSLEGFEQRGNIV